MIFRILGPLEVVRAGHICTPTASKPQQTLALLLLRANHVVPVSQLIEELWGDSPPASAVTTTQTYAYQLRKILHGHDRQGHEGVELVTRPLGYLLKLREGQLDLHTFTRLTAQGRALIERGDIEAGVEQFRRAESMWRGSAPIPEVPQGPLLQAHLTLLAEERIRALALRIHADMALHRYHDVIGELRALVIAHPLNESLHGLLIRAFYAVGRRGEALAACMNLRRILQDELGVDLSLEVRDLQRKILAGEAPEPSPLLTYVS
ncbi:AfsR/SARP family transcriptional regulator [Streptosporangium sp. KLBMP 9127]|nr:AfsR/SARP family transcriptional regulator [Streptosporangium sp. KLBMP 9127]